MLSYANADEVLEINSFNLPPNYGCKYYHDITVNINIDQDEKVLFTMGDHLFLVIAL